MTVAELSRMLLATMVPCGVSRPPMPRLAARTSAREEVFIALVCPLGAILSTPVIERTLYRPTAVARTDAGTGGLFRGPSSRDPCSRANQGEPEITDDTDCTDFGLPVMKARRARCAQ